MPIKNLYLLAFLLFSFFGNLNGQCGEIDFYNGIWDNNSMPGFDVNSNSGSTTLPCGTIVTVTFGAMGNGNYNGLEDLDLAPVNGFALKCGASYSVDKIGDNLLNVVTMEVEFSAPSWAENWTLGDVDASWNTNWKTWRESIFIEGWTTTSPGAMGSGDISATYSDIGSNFDANPTVINNVSGYLTGTSSSPALDEDGEIDFSIGTASNPIKSFRMYLVNKGNLNQNSGHNITIQNPDDGPINIYTPSAVPIELASFSAKEYNDGVQLNWTTNSEINNDKFIIEKSKDGKLFTFLAEVKSQGNSTHSRHYSYWDDNINEQSLYYRLRQIDFDGSLSFSDIVSVTFENPNTVDFQDVNIYPNPANDRINIQSKNNLSEYNIQLFDLMGKLQDLTFDANTSTVDIAQLRSGVYMLLLRNNSGEILFSEKIIKQ